MTKARPMSQLRTTAAVPLVTTIIPAYNHENYVEKCLLSALEQTYQNLEIIVIDDGSSDRTATLVDKLLREAGHNRHVTFIQQENKGLSRTLNKALSLCKGEFIQFLASDDAYLPEKTAVCVQALMSANDRVAAVYSDGYLINDQNEKIMRFSDKYPRPLSSDTHKELLIGNWIPALGLLYKKSAIDQVGGFDESLAVEDYDFLLRLSSVFEFISVPQKLFLYRWHEGNFSKNQERMAEQLKLVREKHIDLLSFHEFTTSLRGTALTDTAKNFSFQNLDLLIRNRIRKIQTKHSIQNVSRFELASLLFQKCIRLAKARINATVVSLRGIKMGRGAKVYGRVRVVGNKKNIRIGDRAVIKGDVTLISAYMFTKDQIHINDDVVIEHNSMIYSLGGDIYIGNGCFIGPNVIIQGNGDVKIGDFTMLASNSCIYANNHVTELTDQPFKCQGNRFIGVTIGKNCWIGAGVSILDGTSLADNSVVGANCVLKGHYSRNAKIIGTGVRGHTTITRGQI